MSIKVLHLIDSGGLYGAEVVLLNLVEEQIKAGLKPLILSAGTPDIDEKPLEKAALDRGLPLKKWRMKAGLNLLDAWKILGFAKEQKIQILHSHGYKFNVLMGMWPRAVRKMRLIATLHGYVNAPKYSKLWVYEQLDRAILKRLDAVVVVNPVMKKIPAISELNPEKIQEIDNGILLDLKVNESANIDDHVSRFIADHSPIVGAIGRLSPEKGLPYLMQAIKELRRNYSRIGLLIIGEGRERENLQAMVQQLGIEEQVLMPGYRSPITDYMAKMDVLVMPSLTEGLPMTLLEAMLVGTPVVASAVGGIPKLLGSNDFGRVVEPKSVDSIVESIDLIIQQPSLTQQTIAKAKRQIEENYSSLSMAVKYESLYNKLVGVGK